MQNKHETLKEHNTYILDRLTRGGRIKNAAGLAGELTELHKVSQICGYKFNGYLAKMETKRPSGIIDEVTVVFKEAAVDRGKAGDGLRVETYLRTGSGILITGRQQAIKDFTSGKVLVYILADYIGLSPKAVPQNEVAVMGELVFHPTFRTTPAGTHIVDIFVKVPNEITGADSYIPCICWNKNADRVAGWKPGDRVKLLGRCQSRKYRKKLGDTEEIRTAYELSVSLVRKAGGKGNED